LKTTQNHANYLKSTLKNLQNTLFLNTPKWLYISGPRHLARAKKRENNTKSKRVGTRIFGALKTGLNPKNVAVSPKVNNQRCLKILQKSLISMHPKSTQISIQGVSEIRVLILTSGRTGQIMELFSITFLRKRNTI
jgi:hypothetical protein